MQRSAELKAFSFMVVMVLVAPFLLFSLGCNPVTVEKLVVATPTPGPTVTPVVVEKEVIVVATPTPGPVSARASASGGGINLKMMLDPQTGDATVPLAEVFTFDESHAICRVETNPHAFKMQTHQMGEVLVEPNQFFMSMVATSIEEQQVSRDPDGKRRVTMGGELDCVTQVGQATVTIGTATGAEPATYLIEAVDGGPGGGEAGDTFSFTVFFTETAAPINYAIFGPEFTFTGIMVEGEVTILDLQ